LNPVSIIKRLFDLIEDIFEFLIARHSFIFLKLDLPVQNFEWKVEVEEFVDYSDELLLAYQRLGRSFNRTRIESRFSNGLKYYCLSLDDTLVASTWIHPKGNRFIDESGYMIQPKSNSVWLRDVFVSPEYRGRKLFETLIYSIFMNYYPEKDSCWSDIEAENSASITAHQNSGFVRQGGFRCMHLVKLILNRDELDSDIFDVSGFKPGKSTFVTGVNYQKYREKNYS